MARDVNGDGIINDITELMGSAGVSGFDALIPFDANLDGIVDATEADAAGLLIWKDTSTGNAYDVALGSNPFVSEWLTDVTITAQALTLPEVTGHGTLPDLRAANDNNKFVPEPYRVRRAA